MAVFVPAPDDGMLRISCQHVFVREPRRLEGRSPGRDTSSMDLSQHLLVAITEQFAKSQIAEFNLLIRRFPATMPMG